MAFRKSHYWFIGVCILWVLGYVYILEEEVIDEEGIYYWLGRATASLWIPAIIYGGYLFFQKRREKKV